MEKDKIKQGKCCTECSGQKCELLEAEREAAVSSLKSHLSEQRHDFLNLLQIIYGYTQLKKPEKVLSQINIFSKKMENIGAIYNAKCIKLADLLYTKGKEAEIVDLLLHYEVAITFGPEITRLEDSDIAYAIDGMLSNSFYALHDMKVKGCDLVFMLKENVDSFDIEVCCRSSEYAQKESLPEDMQYAAEDFYWHKISRQVPSARTLEKHCADRGYGFSVHSGGKLFSLRIVK